MPGLVCIIGRDDPQARAAMLERMLSCLEHEPWLERGTHVDAEIGVWIGWTGHAGSAAADLPAWNGTGDACVVVAGDASFEPVAGDASHGGGRDRAFARYGELLRQQPGGAEAIAKTLVGQFSGVVVDRRDRTVEVFNDRHGLGRLYSYSSQGVSYLASEAKALLEVLPELRAIDMDSLAEVFSCGAILGDRALFRGVETLPPGSVWRFVGDRTAQRRRYVDIAALENCEPMTADAFYEALRATMERIAPRYLTDDDPIAMSLTGGLDSRMLMASARAAPGSLPCYTFGGPYRDCADVALARRVASACGQAHDTLGVQDDFFDDFPRLAEQSVYLSDGTMDVSGAVELYANRLARRIAPVRATGSYGSEIVRGHVAFKPEPVSAQVLAPEFGGKVAAAAETYVKARDCHPLSFIAFKQVPWHHYPRYSLEASQLSLRLPYLDAELVSLLYAAPRGMGDGPELSLRIVADGLASLAALPTDRGLLLDASPVIGTLRRRTAEFSFKAEYAYDHGMPQWLARIDHALSPLRLERLFLGRHKFHHFRVWYRDRLAHYVRDVLLDDRSRSRPYLHGPTLERMVNAHLKGNGNYTAELHQLLRAELVQRRFVERS